MRNPYHSLYQDTVIPDTNAASATPRDVLYSYLLSLKVNDFKGPNKPLKRHKIPQSLAKQAMVSCLLCVAAKRVSDGGGAVEYDGGHVVEKGAATAWFKSRDRHHLSLRLAPCNTSLQKFSPFANKEKGATRSSVASGGGALPIDEFARLLSVLIDDDEARSALLLSGLNLSREQLDRREGRDEFWISVVEARFNDPEALFILPGGPPPTYLTDVNAAAPPAAHRSGDFLKSKFFEIRAAFTTWHQRWAVSGNYDTGNFRDFVARPAPGSAAHPNVARCALVLFHALRVGEKNCADMAILDWVTKTANEVAMYDDADPDPMPISKKARRSSDTAVFSETVAPALEKMSACFADLAGGSQSAEAAKIEAEAARAKNIGAMLDEARNLSQKIRTAEADAVDDDDDEILMLMKQQKRDLIVSLRRLTSERVS
jgi:hypothetical protein